jgi:hypothetical protein
MRRLAAALVTVVALAACGSSGTRAERAASSTTDHLRKIRSGTLSMLLLASADASAEGRGEGFQVSGPFAVASRKGRLPVADLQFTRILGAERETTRFRSTGTRAYLTAGGRTSVVPRSQVSDLFARGGDSAGPGGLDGIHLDDWMRKPRLSAGGHVDGVAVDRLTGAVDPVAAINDLVTLASDFETSNANAPRLLKGDDATRVRRAVREADVEVLVGRQDRLLRRLHLVIHFALSDQNRLRQALRSFSGAKLTFDLGVGHPNRPVTVRPPV